MKDFIISIQPWLSEVLDRRSEETSKKNLRKTEAAERRLTWRRWDALYRYLRARARGGEAAKVCPRDEGEDGVVIGDDLHIVQFADRSHARTHAYRERSPGSGRCPWEGLQPRPSSSVRRTQHRSDSSDVREVPGLNPALLKT